MSFVKGSVTCRPLLLPSALGHSALSAFEAHSLPMPEYIKDDGACGWTGGRYMLDPEINEETSAIGGYIRVHLVSAERKVDKALLASRLQEATLRRCREAGVEFLGKRERAEVYDSVYKALLEKSPVQYKPTSVVCPPDSRWTGLEAVTPRWVYTDAVSPAACDLLVSHIQAAQRVAAKAMDAAALCTHLTNGVIQENHFTPLTLSDTVQEAHVLHNLGCDFLTWLWYAHDKGEPLFNASGQRIQLLVEGPLLFVTEGAGAHEVLLRKGVPQSGAECAACFAAGKKLASCKLSLAVGDNIWAGTFDAMEFTVRSLKLPEHEDALDAVSLFQQRMDHVSEYWRMLHTLYTGFLRARATPGQWGELVSGMRDWAKSRTAAAE